MQCPIDGAKLVLAERSGVEIDYCPECRGVWLDRGELDKIIDRSAPEASAPQRATITGIRTASHGKSAKVSWRVVRFLIPA